VSNPASRWDALTGGERGVAYAARFAELAATGVDVHGEAAMVAGLVPPGARVLDAGCGTGRVAIRLAQLGYDCLGVDADASMLAQARRLAPELPWLLADLAALEAVGGQLAIPFDLVVAAGNVVPLLAAGTGKTVLAALAGRLRVGGLVVAGFGLDPAHLPLSDAPVDLPTYDSWCACAGLEPAGRFAGWDGAPYRDGGYAVSLHRRIGA